MPMLAANSGNTVRLWNVATWEIVAEFAGQAAEVHCLRSRRTAGPWPSAIRTATSDCGMT